MKKFLLVLVAIIAFSAIVIWVAVEKAKDSNMKNRQNPQSQYQDQNSNQDVDAAREQMIKDVKNSKDFVGVIRTTSDPKGKDVRFFQVEADVLNVEELKNVDFARKSPDLPMTKQNFKVAVDESTKIVNAENKEAIESGDMVKVTSGSSIYETTEFTATEVELVAPRQK